MGRSSELTPGLRVRCSVRVPLVPASATGRTAVFQAVEPFTPTPAGLAAYAGTYHSKELDVTWEARAPYWVGEVEVTNASGEATSFEHLFQSGRYQGTLLTADAKPFYGGTYFPKGKWVQLLENIGTAYAGEHRSELEQSSCRCSSQPQGCCGTRPNPPQTCR